MLSPPNTYESPAHPSIGRLSRRYRAGPNPIPIPIHSQFHLHRKKPPLQKKESIGTIGQGHPTTLNFPNPSPSPSNPKHNPTPDPF